MVLILQTYSQQSRLDPQSTHSQNDPNNGKHYPQLFIPYAVLDQSWHLNMLEKSSVRKIQSHEGNKNKQAQLFQHLVDKTARQFLAAISNRVWGCSRVMISHSPSKLILCTHLIKPIFSPAISVTASLWPAGCTGMRFSMGTFSCKANDRLHSWTFTCVLVWVSSSNVVLGIVNGSLNPNSTSF